MRNQMFSATLKEPKVDFLLEAKVFVRTYGLIISCHLR